MVLGVCFLSEVPGLLKIENPLRLYGENGKKGSSNADSQSRDPSQFQVPLPFLGYEAQGESEKCYSSKSEEVTGSCLLLGSCWGRPKQTIMIKGR